MFFVSFDSFLAAKNGRFLNEVEALFISDMRLFTMAPC